MPRLLSETFENSRAVSMDIEELHEELSNLNLELQRLVTEVGGTAMALGSSASRLLEMKQEVETLRGLIAQRLIPIPPPPPAPIGLTPSGPLVITENNTIVQDLEITAGAGVHAIDITAGVTGVTVRRCKIRHNLDGKGIFARSGNHGITIQDVDIQNNHGSTLSSYAGYAIPDLNVNIHIGHSNDITIQRARLKWGASGIYCQGSVSPHNTNVLLEDLEGYNCKGIFPRGQLFQISFHDNVTVRRFSQINDPANDRAEDLWNCFSSSNILVELGLTQGGGSPSGTGGLVESSCVDAHIRDCDALDPHNVGLGGHASASVQSHGTLMTRCRVKMGYTPYERWQDTLGRRYPSSANLTSQDANGVPTTGPLVWSAQGGTNLFELCKWHYVAASYDPNSEGGEPLNLLFPSGNASYVTSQAVDLAFEDFTPRAAIVLTMPWE